MTRALAGTVALVVLACHIRGPAEAGRHIRGPSAAGTNAQSAAPPIPLPGIVIEDLAAPDAQPALRQSEVFVVPLASPASDHGPHARAIADWKLADFFRRQLATMSSPSVVVGPILPASSAGQATLPAFNLSAEALADFCRAASRAGPKRFYALTVGPAPQVQATASTLAAEGLLLRTGDVLRLADPPTTLHAGSVETALLLHAAREIVDMARAPSFGDIARDASSATVDQGQRFADGIVRKLTSDLLDLRRALLPPARSPVRVPMGMTGSGASPQADAAGGDTRAIVHR